MSIRESGVTKGVWEEGQEEKEEGQERKEGSAGRRRRKWADRERAGKLEGENRFGSPWMITKRFRGNDLTKDEKDNYLWDIRSPIRLYSSTPWWMFISNMPYLKLSGKVCPFRQKDWGYLVAHSIHRLRLGPWSLPVNALLEFCQRLAFP